MQDDLSLEQLVSFPTRAEKTLDLVFTTHPSLVDKCKPLPSVGKSDHDIVLVDLCISPTIAKTQQRKIFMWKNANNNAIRTKIRELTTNIIEMVRKGTTVSELWTIFKETLCTIINSNVPTKLRRSRHSNPWMNTTLKRIIQRRHRAYNKARSSQHHKVWDRYKHMKTATQRELRNAHDKYIDDILLGDIHNEPEILVIPEREATG
jgi:hypothetical protein